MEINTYLYLLLKYYLETMRMYNDYLLEYLIVMKFNNRNIVNEMLRMWSNNIVNEIHLKKKYKGFGRSFTFLNHCTSPLRCNRN